jgi:hypothetical protein
MTETILWRRIDLPGHEIATLDALNEGWRLSGTAIFLSEHGPSKLNYVVICDSSWQTTSAKISGVVGSEAVNLVVSANAERKWHLNGVECGGVEGCIDIDLGFSPSTNLLPIRRFALGVGQEATVTAAWLPFPSLRFELLPQLYRRDTERTYHYESRYGLFTRTLEVDSTGFVTSYPDLWQAESTAAGLPAVTLPGRPRRQPAG